MAGASRTELLQWLNELLQLNYTKVEQCGAGGAYLQVLDSIYGDIPMARVKMNAKQEYEYLANYKILQAVFKAKKIDKPVLVEKLVKCKMQ
jgi:RP/EB family microtubule-associated protein